MQQLSLTVKCVTRIGRSSAGRPRHKWIERFQVPAGGWSGGIPLWPRSILNASLWGGWRTDAGDGESPRYVIMLAECGGPCGPAGGTDHLVLSLCVSMSVMERQKRKEREPAVVHLQNHSGLLLAAGFTTQTLKCQVTGDSFTIWWSENDEQAV